MQPLYSVERTYPFPAADLWQAWTDARALEQWYAPVDLAVVPGSVESEPVVGGWWTVAVDVPQYSMVAYFFGRYTVAEVGHRIEHTLHYTQSAEDFAARDESTPFHVVSIDFEDAAEGTRVRWTQAGEMPEEQVAQTKAGMESYFDSLGKYLAR